ncbi:MAG: hypothetical protein RLZZ450_5778 [Pseudomonadota bacterium]|jgi:hypothetical protein
MQTSAREMLAVYTVIRSAEGAEIRLRIGSGQHNDDDSLTVQLDAMPINGKLEIRRYLPRDRSHPRRTTAGVAV